MKRRHLTPLLAPLTRESVTRCFDMPRFPALAVVALGVFVAQHASAADPDDTPISRTCRLCGRLAPELGLGVPVWVPMVIGTFGYDSTAPPLQIDSSIRFAFMGRLSLRAWGIELKAESFGVGFNSRFDRREEKEQGLDASALISRGVAAYHLPPIAFGRSSRAVLLGFVPYAGARLQRISGQLPEPQLTDVPDRSLAWWYGLAGTAVEVDFRVGLTMRFEFDVGGFKPDSNMALWAAISSEYAFTSWFALSAGWNFYQLEHDADALDLRIRLNGPELALSFYLH
jgi:hypothetical protein